MVRVTRRTADWPSSVPRPRPRAVPTAEASAVSTRIKAKTWTGVVPRARRVPNTARRCTTLKSTVL